MARSISPKVSQLARVWVSARKRWVTGRITAAAGNTLSVRSTGQTFVGATKASYNGNAKVNNTWRTY